MKSLALILISSFTILNISCKKEDDLYSDENKTKRNVLFTIYTEKGSCDFKYYDINGWQEESINTSNYQKNIEVYEEDFSYVNSIKTIGPDSLYIKAESNGESVTSNFRSNSTGTLDVSVQLSQLN